MTPLNLTEKSIVPIYPPLMLDNWQIYCPLIVKQESAYTTKIPIPSHLRLYCTGRDIYIYPNGGISIGKFDFNLNGKKLLSKKIGFEYPRRSKDPSINQIFPSEIDLINKWLGQPNSAQLPEMFFKNQLVIFDDLLSDLQTLFDNSHLELNWRPNGSRRIHNGEIYQDFQTSSDLEELSKMITRAICKSVGEPDFIVQEIEESKSELWRYKWPLKFRDGILRNATVGLKLYQKSNTSYRFEIQAKDVSYLNETELYGFSEWGRQILLVAQELAFHLKNISKKIMSEDPSINDEYEVMLTNTLSEYLGDLTAEKNKQCLNSFLEYGVYTPSKHKGKSISQWIQKKLCDPDTGICFKEMPPSEFSNTPKSLCLRPDWKTRIHISSLEQKQSAPTAQQNSPTMILPKFSRRDFFLNIFNVLKRK